MGISFLIVSKESWSDKRWARKQWLPYYLAQRSEVEQLVYFNRHYAWWRKETPDIAGSTGKVTVRQAHLMFPGERCTWVRRFNRVRIARRLLSAMDAGKQWIVILYHPWDAPMIPILSRRAMVIFDWTEDWADYHDMPNMRESQKRAVCSADGVMVVSETLRDQAIGWRGSDKCVFFVPNATALEPVDTHAEEPESLKGIPHPRIGFVGQAGPWFDADLVAGLARSHPEWNWLMFGGWHEEKRRILSDCEPVYWLGIHRSRDIMPFMQHCDVLIAPYVEQVSGDATKLYDYLAAGRPIVSSFCETASRLQPCVHIARGADEWGKTIAALLLSANGPVEADARIETQGRHHWRHRAETLIKFLRSGILS